MEWTEEDVRRIVGNPIYVGMGPYHQIIPDEQWIEANKKIIEEIGSEEWLKQMIENLRKSL